MNLRTILNGVRHKLAGPEVDDATCSQQTAEHPAVGLAELLQRLDWGHVVQGCADAIDWLSCKRRADRLGSGIERLTGSGNFGVTARTRILRWACGLAGRDAVYTGGAPCLNSLLHITVHYTVDRCAGTSASLQ